MAEEKATFGGGCFWCLEAVFEALRGVEAVESGYAGGAIPSPSYERVCSGATGHAEVVQVTFDPAAISFGDLLEVFFATHDPTTLNRQGNDAGTQYRSVVFYRTPEERATAEAAVAEAAKLWPNPIVTEIAPLVRFWKAEDYHQGYFRSNPYQPYCTLVVNPKVAKARQKFAGRMKEGKAE